MYLKEASSPLKTALLKKIREVKKPEKIKSTFIKNGKIHLYEVGAQTALKIPHEIAWEKYLTRINFQEASDSDEESDDDGTPPQTI